MNIVAVRYKNFMAFQDTGWIELRPITLLFGRNSSGKSAVIRGLRLLKQSLSTTSPSDDVLRFIIKEEMNGKIDLKDFETTLHWRNQFAGLEERVETSKLSFAFRYKFPALTQQMWKRITGKQITENKVDDLFLEFTLEFGYDDTRNTTLLAAMHIDCTTESHEQDVSKNFSKVFLSAFRIGTPIIHSTGSDRRLNWEERWYWESDCDIGQPKGSGHNSLQEDWVHTQLSVDSGFLPRLHVAQSSSGTQKLRLSKSDYELCRLVLEQATDEVKTLLEGIDYVGPIRPKPERIYTFDLAKIEDTRRRELSGWLAFLITSENYSVDLNPTHSKTVLPFSMRASQERLLPQTLTEDKDYDSKLTRWMCKLQLGQKVCVERIISDDKENYEFQVLIQEANGQLHNWVDVGYGVSQILPIITACLYAKSGDFIIVEQPELHLHPEAQANLGDLFIETIIKIEQKLGSMEEPKRLLSGVNLFIETHSEHLLLRLQRRVAETTAKLKKLAKENTIKENELLSCLVIKERDTSEIVNMEIDQSGNILDSSARFISFFANDLEEISELTRARFLIDKMRKG